ncbi:hypothetical protein ILUMI_11441 [Ignelater luminosus]|uniref:Uncharacterized protein n=1 Tax=Ignelater luminosus TaxID=2038154 RepID=A0A8K0GAH9_IGNLU|nr:hypothetical protein ILUMI_11441 [Ignelater luminosus]
MITGIKTENKNDLKEELRQVMEEYLQVEVKVEKCIDNDFAEKEREIQGLIREKAMYENSKGKNLKIGYQKLWIDNIQFIWNKKENILETQTKRGSEIYSDHYMVVAKWKVNDRLKEERSTKTQNQKYSESIRTYKLQDREVAEEFKEKLERKMKKKKVIGYT